MTRIERCLRELAQERGPDKTFCPSEVARTLDPEKWRDQMSAVRETATRLVDAGVLRCTQRGKTVDPRTARGAIRLRQSEGCE